MMQQALGVLQVILSLVGIVLSVYVIRLCRRLLKDRDKQ